MGRRASSSLNPVALVMIVAVCAALIGGGAFLLTGKKETFDAPRLHIEDVLSNANSLRGNEYMVEGKVFRREVRDTGEGVSLMVETDGGEEPLFIVIPNDVDHVNIERDREYAFKIRFGEGGVPIATAVKRL